MSFPVPFNEDARLAALYREVDPEAPADPELDRIARLAARSFGAGMGLVTLIDRDSQRIRAAHGTDLCATTRGEAFCAHTILSDAPMVVPDAAADPRFARSRLVVEPPGVRFYAGAPIVTDDGYRLGSVCVMDDTPRTGGAGDGELDILSDLAATAGTVLRGRGAGAAPSESAEAKEAFMRLVGHELRTPLNAIQGFGALLEAARERGELAPTHGAHVGHICTSARHLADLIERVLTFSNLDRGELALSEDELDVAALAADARSIAAGAAVNGEVPVRVEIPADAPRLRADREQLLAMLGNLLTNAVTAPGASAVAVHWRAAADGHALEVSDDGRGLSAQAKADALTPFRQADNRLARAGGGLGLGLPLTQRLIELHGGRLELDTAEGRGTTVRLVFPPWRVLG